MNEYGFRPDPGERILRVIRRHIIDIIPPVAAFVILIILSVLLWFGYTQFPATIPFPPAMVIAMVVIMPIIGALILFIGIFNYRRNVLVFTNVHLVQVEQQGIFSRRVSQLSYKHVQDATGNKAGIFPTIFNYGDVEVQTAGALEKFIFHKAPRPDDVADATLRMHELANRGEDPSEIALAL
ncbi:MAG: hypothetical protein JWN01_440 [Patescibacteria group bacterium]|nr:hypothetical protein [Patescibacteria group bacterium]